MAVYRVLKSIAFQDDDHSAMSAVAGATVDISDADLAQSLLDAGRIEPFDGVYVAPHLEPGFKEEFNDVELADEVPTFGKPSESSTNAELVDYLVKNGVKRSTVEHLKKAELLEAVDRLTHTDDDD